MENGRSLDDSISLKAKIIQKISIVIEINKFVNNK